jgi:hypothetical protein
VVGPYGNIVNFGDGRLYLSWYPAGRLAISKDAILPKVGPLEPAQKARIVEQTLTGLAIFVPGINGIHLMEFHLIVSPKWRAVGFSHGVKATLPTQRNELHRRYDIGAFFDDGYISLNTGKYCMAPLNARRLVKDLLEVPAPVRHRVGTG